MNHGDKFFLILYRFPTFLLHLIALRYLIITFLQIAFSAEKEGS